jgi:hypothetical protein
MREPMPQDLENQSNYQGHRSFNSFTSAQQYGIPASGSISALVNKIPGASRHAPIVNRNLPGNSTAYPQMIPTQAQYNSPMHGAQAQNFNPASTKEDRWGLTANFPIPMPPGGDDADLFAIPNVSAKYKSPLQDVLDYHNVKPHQASELVW